jgi:uncharacterized protein with HEPN domain
MRDARHRLEDIRRAILDTRTFVADLDQAAFLKTPLEDRKTFRAVAACLQEIGEAVKALPPEVTSRHTDIPRRLIAGMHDHIAHVYYRVDADIIGATIASGELEALLDAVSDELK